MSDERPKPKYGELAPPGWTWQPPAPPVNDSDVPAPSGVGADAGREAPYSAPPPPYVPPRGYAGPTPGGVNGAGGMGAGPDARKPVSSVDVAVTGILLFIGVLLSASMLPTLFDFNTILGQAAAAQGYTGYAPSTAATAAGVIAGVATIVLQLLAIVIGVRRLQRRRLAFPFVLGLGMLTFVIWIVAILFAFFNDPSFMQQVMSSTAP